MDIVAFLLIIRKLKSYNFLHDVTALITWQQVSVAESFACLSSLELNLLDMLAKKRLKIMI